MRDVTGYPLELGDKVAISRTGYREMVIGTIVKETDKGMKVRYTTTVRNGEIRTETTQRNYSMVCKVQD